MSPVCNGVCAVDENTKKMNLVTYVHTVLLPSLKEGENRLFLGKVLIYIIFCNVNKSLLGKDKNIVFCFTTHGYLPVPVLSTVKRALPELSKSLPGSHCCKLTSKTCSFRLGPKLQ